MKTNQEFEVRVEDDEIREIMIKEPVIEHVIEQVIEPSNNIRKESKLRSFGKKCWKNFSPKYVASVMGFIGIVTFLIIIII